MSGPIEFYQAQYEWIQAWFAAHQGPVVTPPAPPIVVPPRTQADDFAAAVASPGHIRSFTLRDPADLGTYNYGYAGKGYGWGKGSQADPIIDDRGLHFFIQPHSSENAGGSWGFKFSDDDSILIGEGESEYLRWMQRWSSGMRDIVAQNKGTKFLDIGTGGQADPNLNTTNSNTKVVMQTHYGWMAPILYTYPNQGLEEVVPSPTAGGYPDYKFQNAVDGCLYSNNGSGCWQMPTEEDVCFQLGIEVLDRVDEEHVNTHIRLWGTKGGVTTLLHDWHPGVTGYVPQYWPKGEKHARVNVFPFMTAKDETKDHPLGHVWVWYMALSRERMPDPLSLEQSPEPVVPVAKWAMIAHDFDPVTLTAGVYRYGAEPAWTYLQLPAGAYTVLPDSWGLPDPAPGVRKSLDRWTDASPPDVSPIITPGGAPTPAHPAPPIVVPPSSGAFPAWRRGAKVGQWLTLPGTENCSGVIPWEGSINAWGGLAASDTALSSAGSGGHGEPQNPAFTIDLMADAPAWRLLRASTPIELATYEPRYKDGSACSRHLYTNIQWLAAEHSKDGHAHIILTGSYATYGFELTKPDGTPAFNGGPQVDSFNVDTGEWDAAGFFGNMPLWQALPVVTRDRRDGRIYYCAGYTYARWTPQTDTWDMPGGRPGYRDTGLAAWDRRCCTIDVKRNQLVGIVDTYGPLRIQRVDLASNAVTDVVIAGMPNVSEGAALTVDEDGDRYLYMDQGKVWAINPDTGAASLAYEIQSAKASTENRFVYFPKLGGVAYVPSYEAPAMFLPTR